MFMTACLLSAHQTPSVKGSIKRKNLFPMGVNSFLLENATSSNNFDNVASPDSVSSSINTLHAG